MRLAGHDPPSAARRPGPVRRCCSRVPEPSWRERAARGQPAAPAPAARCWGCCAARGSAAHCQHPCCPCSERAAACGRAGILRKPCTRVGVVGQPAQRCPSLVRLPQRAVQPAWGNVKPKQAWCRALQPAQQQSDLAAASVARPEAEAGRKALVRRAARWAPAQAGPRPALDPRKSRSDPPPDAL